MNLHNIFQDDENLYFVMDLMTGGDLAFNMDKVKKEQGGFTEEQTKFIVANVILGLKAMNKRGYMHKDMKPGNLLFDERGYIKICDYGMAEKTKPGVKRRFGGTHSYRAPEVVLHQRHEASVDYYALGVMTYNIMLCRRFPVPSKEKLP